MLIVTGTLRQYMDAASGSKANETVVASSPAYKHNFREKVPVFVHCVYFIHVYDIFMVRTLSNVNRDFSQTIMTKICQNLFK